MRDLVAGKRYLAVPSRGGMKTMRETVQKVGRYTKNQASKSEGELEEAIVKYGLQLLGWPFGIVATAVALPNLHTLTPPGQAKSLEFDAVVEVTSQLWWLQQGVLRQRAEEYHEGVQEQKERYMFTVVSLRCWPMMAGACPCRISVINMLTHGSDIHYEWFLIQP